MLHLLLCSSSLETRLTQSYVKHCKCRKLILVNHLFPTEVNVVTSDIIFVWLCRRKPMRKHLRSSKMHQVLWNFRYFLILHLQGYKSIFKCWWLVHLQPDLAYNRALCFYQLKRYVEGKHLIFYVIWWYSHGTFSNEFKSLGSFEDFVRDDWEWVTRVSRTEHRKVRFNLM